MYQLKRIRRSKCLTQDKLGVDMGHNGITLDRYKMGLDKLHRKMANCAPDKRPNPYDTDQPSLAILTMTSERQVENFHKMQDKEMQNVIRRAIYDLICT